MSEKATPVEAIESASPEPRPETGGQEDTQSEKENPLKEGLIEHREMYQLPPLVEISEGDIQRYLEGNEKISRSLPEIIKQGFEDYDWSVRAQAAEMILHAPEEERPALRERALGVIQQGLKDEGWSVRETAAGMIPHAPKEEQPALRERALGVIQQGLKDGDWSVRAQAAEMILHAPEEERPALRERVLEIIQQGLEDNNSWDTRKRAVVLIPQVPEEARARLIQKGLEDKDWSVRAQAAEMILHAPKKARARLIQKGLEDKDWSVRAQAAEMILHAPKEAQADKEAQAEFIRQGLGDGSSFVREIAVGMIDQAPEEEQKGLWELAEKQGLKKSAPSSDMQVTAAQTPLYKDGEKFFRKGFAKSGSRTTLLDAVPGQPEKTHRGRVITRHIDLHSYFIWREAFEAHDYWRGNGFDYVPIEPIIRARLPQGPEATRGRVDVFTRVLPGPSLDKWKREGGGFQREIHEQRERIRGGLEELGVRHGHLHNNNFVLYFPRKEDGQPDISHPPRVYAIDFDMAESSEPTE